MDTLTSPKRLVIVGDDEGQDSDVVEEISDILDSHEVLLYSIQKLDPLVSDIKMNAYKNGPSTTFP